MSSITTVELTSRLSTNEPPHVERQIGFRFLDVLYIKDTPVACQAEVDASDSMSVMTLHSDIPMCVTEHQSLSISYHLPKLHEEVTDVQQLYVVQHAIMPKDYHEFIIQISEDTTHIRLPQQPFIVKCGILDIDCSVAPVQLSSNVPIRALKVVRHDAFELEPAEFYVGTRHKEFDIDFGINYSTNVNILYMPHRFSVPLDLLKSMYVTKSLKCEIGPKPRFWMMTSYDKLPINKVSSKSITHVSAFVIMPNVPYMCQTKQWNYNKLD
ncbi:hypothetical protein OnM2_098035 [Erysiphe neolycopersici]|uniref:Uncharacterized protein n=1 Tax=Erysiphe neolycopersici TaxID=212602 RepID=A0A420HA55_9PEZI|nr:hypothetical protein OnM2_098035 [Erysiphe neolycopersici]